MMHNDSLCTMEIHAVRPCLSDGVSSMLLGSSWQQDMIFHLGELMGTQVCTYIYIYIWVRVARSWPPPPWYGLSYLVPRSPRSPRSPRTPY